MSNDPSAYTQFTPFGLEKDAEPGKIRIRLAFESGKPDAGKQEMILTGDGRVRLLHSRSSLDPKPKILDGTCDAKSIMSLLDLMEANGVMGMPERIGGEPKGRSQRVLELNLPGRTKRVAVVEDGGVAINEIFGAVKLAAGQCLPEALNHRLFPNL
jgi:hypothetical protein